MGANTEIAWTEHTFNGWWGCQRVSPGCQQCYAEAFAKRVGEKVWGPTAGRRFFGDKHWDEPLAWNERARKAGVRARVFCSSMADVFEDRRDLDVERSRLWILIENTPWLDWQLLTKRPENMIRLASACWGDKWPPNAWAGCTVENQEYAEERIPLIATVPAAVRFLSCEPLLGPLNLFGPALADTGPFGAAWIRNGVSWESDFGREHDVELTAAVDWVIVGGESGQRARPFAIEWARSIVKQCRDAQVACFVKQLGSAPHGEWGDDNAPTETVDDITSGKLVHVSQLARHKNGRWRLRDRKGGSMTEWPSDLRVREFPVGATP